MQVNSQNSYLWGQLYEAAVAFRNQQPWRWMYDSYLFAIADPQTGERAYCSVMGNAEEVFAIAVYFGAEGLASFDALFNAAEEGTGGIEEGLEQRCLMVSFVDREEMTDPDLAQIKALGLKFRGSNQWVQFRRHDPGYLPWYIDVEDAQRLIPVLQQALIVTGEVRDNPDLIEEAEGCLVRRPVPADPQTWETIFEPWPELPDPLVLPVDDLKVKALRMELPREEGALLLASTFLPGGILEEKDPRPYFGRLAMWLHHPSGSILKNEVFHPDEFEENFGDWFLGSLREMEVLPQQIGVNSRKVYHLIGDLCEALEIELLFAPDLEAFDEVFSFLMQFMQDFDEE